MTHRLRIRTLKPEVWQDEKVGKLSRDARLLFVGLITLADDDGRFRALDSLVLGHVFPYDTDAPRKLAKWMKELGKAGLVLIYEVDSVVYGAFPKWSSHQKINRKNDSILPAPALNGHGLFTETARSTS